MVLIWNTLSGGDSDYCTILVAINSILQIALFSPYAMLFMNIVSSWFDAPVNANINVDLSWYSSCCWYYHALIFTLVER
jgi:ACR3 family arsenite transporter